MNTDLDLRLGCMSYCKLTSCKVQAKVDILPSYLKEISPLMFACTTIASFSTSVKIRIMTIFHKLHVFNHLVIYV